MVKIITRKIYVGITEDNELIEAELSINKDGETRIRSNIYRDLVEEEEGEAEAIKTLSDVQYWADLGFISEDSPLLSYINFEEVAEDTVNTDGWENVNGEYEYKGDYGGKSYFFNLSGIGGNYFAELLNANKALFVNMQALKTLIKYSHRALTSEPARKELDRIFSYDVPTEQVIGAWLETS